MVTHWCTVCAAETEYEAVPCQDGHGGDCPDLLCVECGYVIVVAGVVEPETTLGVTQAA